MLLEREPARETLKDKAMEHLQVFGIVQLREFIDIGVPSIILRRLLCDGLLLNPARGVYMLKEFEDDPMASFAIEAVSAPPGIICLTTAAYINKLVSRDARELWLAVPPGSWQPKELGFVPVRCVKWGCVEPGPSIEGPSRGIPATMDFEMVGRAFSITTPARTVVDLFNYRNTIGVDLAVEALGTAVANGVPISEIEAFAEDIGISGMMDPYIAGAGASLNRRY